MEFERRLLINLRDHTHLIGATQLSQLLRRQRPSRTPGLATSLRQFLEDQSHHRRLSVGEGEPLLQTPPPSPPLPPTSPRPLREDTRSPALRVTIPSPQKSPLPPKNHPKSRRRHVVEAPCPNFPRVQRKVARRPRRAPRSQPEEEEGGGRECLPV